MSPSSYLRFNKIIRRLIFLFLIFNLLIPSSYFYIGYDLKQDVKVKNVDSNSLDRGIHSIESFIFGFSSKKFGNNDKLNYGIEFIPDLNNYIEKMRFWSFFIKRDFFLNSSLNGFINFGVSDVKISDILINGTKEDRYLTRKPIYGFGFIIKEKIQLSYTISKLNDDNFLKSTISRINLSYLFSK